MKNLDNITISGSTVQNWEATSSGNTVSVFTETTTSETDIKPIIVLTGPPRTNNELYVATGGIISPNVYYRFVH
ncbi:MAG: hypothetical protein WCL18_04215 [bacterium]